MANAASVVRKRGVRNVHANCARGRWRGTNNGARESSRRNRSSPGALALHRATDTLGEQLARNPLAADVPVRGGLPAPADEHIESLADGAAPDDEAGIAPAHRR